MDYVERRDRIIIGTAGIAICVAMAFGLILGLALAKPETVTVTEVREVPVEVIKTVPGPSVRVEVTPEVCVDAVQGMADYIVLQSDVIVALSDETLTEDLVNEYLAASERADRVVNDAEQCLAGTDIGS